jgi:hypothetical protein
MGKVFKDDDGNNLEDVEKILPNWFISETIHDVSTAHIIFN